MIGSGRRASYSSSVRETRRRQSGSGHSQTNSSRSDSSRSESAKWRRLCDVYAARRFTVLMLIPSRFSSLIRFSLGKQQDKGRGQSPTLRLATVGLSYATVGLSYAKVVSPIDRSFGISLKRGMQQPSQAMSLSDGNACGGSLPGFDRPWDRGGSQSATDAIAQSAHDGVSLVVD